MLGFRSRNGEAIIRFNDIQNRFTEANVGLESLQLLNQTLSQLFASQISKARHIQNLLLWIENGWLTAQLRQRINDFNLGLAQMSVKCSE